MAILLQFLTSNVHFVRKGCDGYFKIAILLSVFDVQRPFRAKGLRWILQNRNFTISFWRPTSISCERVLMDTSKSQFYHQFLTSNVHFVRKGCDVLKLKSQFYFSFWRPTFISCERVARDTSKSQFYLSFWRPTSISCERVAFRGAPAASPPP